MQKRRPISRRGRGRPFRVPSVWLSRHLQVALASLGRLVRRPFPSAMTVAVIGIALALPGGLYVLTKNLEALSGSWDQSAAISLFLRSDVTGEQATALAGRLREHADLEEVRLISPEDALEELRGQSGFAEAVDQLEENPLPMVLALRPTGDMVAPEALDRLREELTELPEADFARLDTQWVRRFQAIVNLAQRGALLLGAVLALAVLLVVGNTIRLEIENRRSEIEIMELVGATPAFIRRPFLYTGAWYGLLGGITAWLLVSLALLLLQGPVSNLAALYETKFPLAGLGPGALLSMLGASLLLGLLGSWLSVGRHLATTEPR
ncbi:MAG: permease-like cell division protein FtsX [Pseudomonadota bacterium]|nr:permease-like cell division protein FtsX [Pseudomonadota bacterium]